MEYIIENEYSNVRLDRFLRKKYPLVSLNEIFKGFRTGKIKVNGKKVKENYRLLLGDVVKVYFDDSKKEKIFFFELSEKEKNELATGIVYEDEGIIIFNKKNNVVMHKGSGHSYGLAEMFKAYYQNNNFNFINRIDKETSGLVIGAKSLEIARILSEELRKGYVIKKYYILVQGNIDENKFTLESFLRKEESKVELYEAEIAGAKRSLTHYEVISRNSRYTLLVGRLESGRTHQLRVQLSHRGIPIVGDKKYGVGSADQMYLYSFYVEIPRYNVKIEMPLPEKFYEKIK
ncbi:RluA family pseudouridine synthase [Fusobacterium sp. PH5-44]|uniref:RluA family pseudouridine synthase n=1 Tax=unclassified Fusobacterium TaxID=2648384 RepID=UPI003D1D144C